ncbi:MAG: VOC family protein [Gemmatimonadales bacterium]
MRLRYTILFVDDLTRSRNFYHDLLGIPIRSEDASSIELDTGEATLALHQAHVGHAGHHPPMATGSARFGLTVDDLSACHNRLVAAGVRCVTPAEARFDYTVCLYEDPDGYYFTLAEPLRR